MKKSHLYYIHSGTCGRSYRTDQDTYRDTYLTDPDMNRDAYQTEADAY